MHISRITASTTSNTAPKPVSVRTSNPMKAQSVALLLHSVGLVKRFGCCWSRQSLKSAIWYCSCGEESLGAKADYRCTQLLQSMRAKPITDQNMSGTVEQYPLSEIPERSESNCPTPNLSRLSLPRKPLYGQGRQLQWTEIMHVATHTLSCFINAA